MRRQDPRGGQGRRLGACAFACFSVLLFASRCSSSYCVGCLGLQVYVIYCDAKTKVVVDKHIAWAASLVGKAWLAQEENAKSAKKVAKANKKASAA